MNRRVSIKWAPKIFCPSEEDKLIWPLQFLTNSMDITDLSPLSCLLVMCSELSLEKKSPEKHGIRAVVCNWILKKQPSTQHRVKNPSARWKKLLWNGDLEYELCCCWLLPQIPSEFEYYMLFWLLCYRKTVTDFWENVLEVKWFRAWSCM